MVSFQEKYDMVDDCAFNVCIADREIHSRVLESRLIELHEREVL